MSSATKTPITVETTIKSPIESVWKTWTQPDHITNWCNASDDWHAPYADNDLREGGTFKTTMAAKDGSMSFDFEGIYSTIKDLELIEYTMGDGRKVSVHFKNQGKETRIIETFDPEDIHPPEFQKGGWQAILDNFRKYTEANQ